MDREAVKYQVKWKGHGLDSGGSEANVIYFRREVVGFLCMKWGWDGSIARYLTFEM